MLTVPVLNASCFIESAHRSPYVLSEMVITAKATSSESTVRSVMCHTRMSHWSRRILVSLMNSDKSNFNNVSSKTAVGTLSASLAPSLIHTAVSQARMIGARWTDGMRAFNFQKHGDSCKLAMMRLKSFILELEAPEKIRELQHLISEQTHSSVTEPYLAASSLRVVSYNDTGGFFLMEIFHCVLRLMAHPRVLMRNPLAA